MPNLNNRSGLSYPEAKTEASFNLEVEMNSLVGLVAASLAEKKISKQKLAEEVGCSQVTLNRKLNGESFLTITEARRLAKALDVDPEEVCKLAPEVN